MKDRKLFKTNPDMAIFDQKTRLEEYERKTLIGKAWVEGYKAGSKDEHAYLTQPALQRKPLTDEQIDEIGVKIFGIFGLDVNDNEINAFARAIEAAHGIGEKT